MKRLHSTRIIAAVAALCVFAGCGGATVPQSTQSGGSLPSVAKTSEGDRAEVAFTIRIPKKRTRGHYVSPATQSMTVVVQKGTKIVLDKIVNLTPTSTGCFTTIKSTQCSIKFWLGRGSYAASITTYDNLNGTGNVLSSAQAVPFKSLRGRINTIYLTLSGIPAEILVLGAGVNSVYVLAQDADGNFIVGSGAPVFTAAQTAGANVATITQPTATHPNLIEFSQNGTNGGETIGVTASYPAGQTNGCAFAGAVCSRSNAVTASFGQALFVANNGGASVEGFTVPLLSSSQQPSYSVPDLVAPFPLAVDTKDNLYVAGYANPGALYVVNAPYGSITATNPGAVDDPYGIALDASGNVYVANSPASNVLVFSPPYTASPTIISNGVEEPYAVAVDGTYLYVANNTFATVSAYALAGLSSASTPAFTLSTSSRPFSLLVSGGNLYVGGQSSIDIWKGVSSASTTPSVTLKQGTQGVTEVYNMALDASGNLFVANQNGGAGGYGTIQEYPGNATSSTLATGTVTLDNTGTDLYYPFGLALDANGNLYVVEESGGAAGNGGILQFATPLSNGKAPTVTLSSAAINLPYNAVMTKNQHFSAVPSQ